MNSYCDKEKHWLGEIVMINESLGTIWLQHHLILQSSSLFSRNCTDAVHPPIGVKSQECKMRIARPKVSWKAHSDKVPIIKEMTMQTLPSRTKLNRFEPYLWRNSLALFPSSFSKFTSIFKRNLRPTVI